MAKNNYINNQEFLAAIVQRKKDLRAAKSAKQPKPPLSHYIGKCLMLIANNLAHLPRFANYPSKEEMIGDAIENCLLYFDNYKTKYKNPHAYFTQISYYAFVRRIQKEKKILYAKYKFHEHLGVLGSMDGVREDKQSSQFQVYENIGQFIETYEEKAAEKKAALAKAKKTAAKPKKRVTRKPRKYRKVYVGKKANGHG